MAFGQKVRSAWFSSSIPEPKVKIWEDCGGSLEQDPFEADFLFSENSEAADVQKIFKSQKFLEGHLIVFSSNVITQAAKREILNEMDIINCILLPQKELDDLGISFSCLREKDVKNVRDDSCKDNRRQTRLKSRTLTTSRNNVSTVCASTDKQLAQSSGTQNEEKLSEFPGTPFGFTSDFFPSTPLPQQNEEVYQVLKRFLDNCEITHLDDVIVPRVRLMDFQPDVHGCEVRLLQKETN